MGWGVCYPLATKRVETYDASDIYLVIGNHQIVRGALSQDVQNPLRQSNLAQRFSPEIGAGDNAVILFYRQFNESDLFGKKAFNCTLRESLF